ncbi:protein of unknown function [Streptomyces sp. cf386]|uniref:DUF4259 domain-containing protein n=1 Tax=Streptomyces sp. cf386 TaxID=1761904 RepID=UPI00088813E2|nr:DUF4259 domain-containing protein [Streptomyces sp. cf386]SDP57906.1 protein of unknown function [Streptomyces sp. cf386]
MGTWGSGPFDNDTAEDTLEELDEMSQRDREETVGSVFRSAVRGARSPSASVLPEEVIVAAAVVAANTPAGARVDWNEDYPSITGWLAKPISPALAASAVEGLQAALPADGWYWGGWKEPQDKAEAEWIDRITSILREVQHPVNHLETGYSP